ncbi:unnamed protein product [Closterium sp. NIES-54]
MEVKGYIGYYHAVAILKAAAFANPGMQRATGTVWKDTEEAEMWYTGLCALVERNRRPKSERLGLSHRRSASMTLDELREWSPDMSPFRQRVESSPPVEPNESSSQADYRSSPESRGTGRGEAMGMDTLTGAEAGAAAGAGTSIGAGTGMNFSRSAHDMSSLHEGILGRSSLFPGSTNTVAGGTSASGSARTFPGSCSTNQPCSEAGTDVSDLDDFSDTLSIGGVSVQSLPPSTTITTTVTTTATTNSPSIPSSTSATATIATAGNTSAAANASNSSTPASANFPYAAAPPPSHSAVIPTSRATSSSTGDDGSEVLGDLFMWGEGLGDGALGGGGLRKRGTSSAIPIPGFDSVVPKPLDAGVVLDVCHVACGEGHAALVTRRGEVFCWGEEGGGRLGQGRERDLEHPKLVEGLDGRKFAGPMRGTTLRGTARMGSIVSRVACSVWHTAAVVHAPTTASTLPSTASSGVTTASDGEATSSVVTSEGTSAAAGAAVAAEGAGAGAEGAVGVGAAGAGGLAGVGSAGGVTAGGVAGPFEGGRLYTWGDGDRYKLGHGNKQQQLLPKAVDALSQVDISQVACGQDITVALTPSGHVYAMGSAAHGQLGNPQADGHTPALVSGPPLFKQVEQIACGTHHTAALTAASDLFTWGRGSHGQLGHGDVRDRELPTRVEAIKDQRVLSRVSIGMLRAQTTTTAQYPFLSWILSLYSLFQSSPSPQVSCGPASTAVVCQHRHAQGSDHHHCTLCRQAFSFARIRHHCYNCSLPVCHACSPRKLLGAAMAPTPTRPYRVCDMCFNKISKVSAGSSGSTSNSSSSGKMSKGSNSISTSSSINLKSSSSTGSSSSSSSSSISSSGSLGGMGSGGGGGAGGGGKPGLFTTSSSGGSAAGGNRGSSAGSGGAAATAAGGNFLSLSSNSASSGSSIGPGAAGMRSSTSRAKAGSFTGTPGLSPGQSPGNATETQHVHARSHDGGSALPLPMWGPVSPPPLFASLVSRQAFAPMAYPHYPHTETQQQQQQQQQQHSQQQQQQHQAGQQASLRKSPSPQPHHAIPSSSTSVSSSLPILPSGFLSHASSSSSSSSSSSPSSTTSWLFSQTSASLSTSIASPTPSSSLAPNSATATTPPTLPSRHSSYSLSPNLPDDSGPPPRASRTISLRGSVAGLVIGSGRRPSSPLMWQSSNSPLGAGRAASPTGAQVAAAAAAAAAAMIAGSSAAGGGVGRVAASGGFPVIGGVGVEPWDWRQQGGAVGSGEARWRKAKEEADKEIQRLREEVERERQAERRLAGKQVEAAFPPSSRAAARAAGAHTFLPLYLPSSHCLPSSPFPLPSLLPVSSFQLRAVKARSAEVERERQAERRLASKQVEAAFSAASRAAARAAGARDVIQLLSQQV